MASRTSQPDASLNIPRFVARGSIRRRPPLSVPGHQPTIAIGYAGGPPAIWTVEHIDAANWCFGQQFDTFANNINEGWACIAVATSDNADNFSVSPPLRVDIEYTICRRGGAAPDGERLPPAPEPTIA